MSVQWELVSVGKNQHLFANKHDNEYPMHIFYSNVVVINVTGNHIYLEDDNYDFHIIYETKKNNVVCEVNKKHYDEGLNIDNDIVNFKNDKHQWSVIASTYHTYLNKPCVVCYKDKIIIYCEVNNLHVFNFDGSLFVKINVIELIEELYVDDNMLIVKGFIWNPLFFIIKINLDKVLSLQEKYYNDDNRNYYVEEYVYEKTNRLLEMLKYFPHENPDDYTFSDIDSTEE